MPLKIFNRTENHATTTHVKRYVPLAHPYHHGDSHRGAMQDATRGRMGLQLLHDRRNIPQGKYRSVPPSLLHGKTAHRLPYLSLMLLALTIIGLALFVMHNAEASAPVASLSTCSRAEVGGTLPEDYRRWEVYDSSNCVLDTVRDAPIVTTSFTITCSTQTAGLTAPGQADTVTVKGVSDNTGFATSSPTAIWTWTPAAACTGNPTFTAYCTDTGLSGGNPKWGIVRIHIRAVRATLGTYDVNSDTDPGGTGIHVPFVGIYRCNPHPNTFTNELGSTGSAPTTYFGNDVYRARFNVSQGTQYSTGNRAKLDITCSATITQGNFVPSSTLTNFDLTLSQSNNTFPDRCTLIEKAILNTKSAIALYSTTDYAVWVQTNPPSGTTFPDSLTIQRSTQQRTVFYDGTKMSNLDDSQSPPTFNVTTFVIGSNNQYFQALDIQNVRNELASGVSGACDQKLRKSDGSFMTVQAGLSIGTSNAGGDFSILGPSVVAPAGRWSLNCTFTLAPNVGFYNVSFLYASPVTSNTGIATSWNVTANGSLYNVNLTVVLRTYDPITDGPVLAIPDDFPKLTLLAYNRSSELFDIYVTNRTIMQQLDGISSAWWYNFTTTQTNLTPMVAYMSFNLTGNPYLGSNAYHLNSTVASTSLGGDSTSLPENVATPIAILTLSLGGLVMGAAFDKKPMVNLGGVIAQVVAVWLALQESDTLAMGYESMLPVFIMAASAFTFYLGWRTFIGLREPTESQMNQQEDYPDGE
jgi:hypothetical protein